MFKVELPTLTATSRKNCLESGEPKDEWHDCASTFEAMAPIVDTVVCASIFAAPGVLNHWQKNLNDERQRPVDAALAARVIQRIQHRIASLGLPPGSGFATTTQQVASIRLADIRDFMRAAGLTDEQVRQAELQYCLATAAASLATLPAAILGTGLSSFIHAIFPGNNIARILGFMLNVILLAVTPYLNALIAQPVGAAADRRKARVYALRIDRSIVSDLYSKTRLSRDLNQSRRHLANTFEHLETTLRNAHAKQLADRRVYLDSRWQQLARYPKTVLAPVGQLLRAARWLSAWASAGFQLGASVGTAALHAVLAGADARTQQHFTASCHLLAAPPLTLQGRARLLQGLEIQPGHIDDTALRATLVGPCEARLLLLARCLRNRIGSNSRRNPAMAAERAAMEADLVRLAHYQVAELEPAGTAACWLLKEGRHDPLLWADIGGRMQKPGEVSGQFCKFVGQQWQVAVGPGYFVLVPKLLNAVSGGRPPLPGMVACAALSALLGIAGCCAFPAVVIECNEMQVRIDASGVAPGFLQTLRHAGVALIALPRQRFQQRRFDRALAAAEKALARRAAGHANG